MTSLDGAHGARNRVLTEISRALTEWRDAGGPVEAVAESLVKLIEQAGLIAVDSRAFLFQPDGDPNAYYCEESDLAFAEDEECPCLSGRPDLCEEHQQAAWDGFITRHGFPDSLRG